MKTKSQDLILLTEAFRQICAGKVTLVGFIQNLSKEELTKLQMEIDRSTRLLSLTPERIKSIEHKDWKVKDLFKLLVTVEQHKLDDLTAFTESVKAFIDFIEKHILPIETTDRALVSPFKYPIKDTLNQIQGVIFQKIQTFFQDIVDNKRIEFDSAKGDYELQREKYLIALDRDRLKVTDLDDNLLVNYHEKFEVVANLDDFIRLLEFLTGFFKDSLAREKQIA